jgi:hypothetical protein
MSILTRIKGLVFRGNTGTSTPAPAPVIKAETPAPVTETPATPETPAPETAPATPTLSPELITQILAVFGDMKPADIAKLIEQFKTANETKVEAETQIADLAKKLESQGQEIKALTKRYASGAEGITIPKGSTGTPAKKTLFAALNSRSK